MPCQLIILKALLARCLFDGSCGRNNKNNKETKENILRIKGIVSLIRFTEYPCVTKNINA